ncbi:hypothetical protein PoB_004868900 [Plakobranchus ocellatus]|uniref:DRBM domain-containing protein n=1 Tax=Plakobranchus ocellatus TaxID=259542 RepID=A0AAV4BUW1_9GAST|nr:hypothetical protein PoB_004868900 [Plakobranchus ocellatus]
MGTWHRSLSHEAAGLGATLSLCRFQGEVFYGSTTKTAFTTQEMASESALKSAGTLLSRVRAPPPAPDLTEGLKPEITLLWTGNIQKTQTLRDVVSPKAGETAQRYAGIVWLPPAP